MKLAIAHISDTLQTGGAEMIIRQLALACRAQGHRVEVHALYAGGEVAEALRKDGVPVFVHGPAGRLALTGRLARALRRGRIGVVHCHNATATIIGAPAARLAGVPVIGSTRHGLVAPPHPWRREGQFGLAARCCHWVAGVCEATTRNLQGLPFARRDRLVTVYNGATPAPGEPAGPLPDPAAGPDACTLLWVGRLAPPKDPVTLLRALSAARSKHPSLRLWVAGSGVLEETARQEASRLGLGPETVCFLGERRDVGALLARADVFTLSSNSEGLPVSLLEAMAAERPVAVTAVGAMPEVVQGGDCGLVVPSGHVEALAGALVRLASEPALRQRLGAAGRHYYERRFTLERMADRYLELYRGRMRHNDPS
jgi:glycosyltransferase involved in cell wall biosynthesis